MPDWMFWPAAAIALGFTAWGGWNAHRDRWWIGTGWLAAWYVGAAVVVAGLIGLWVLHG